MRVQRIDVCVRVRECLVCVCVCEFHTSGIVLSGFVYATVMMMELCLCNVGRVCVQIVSWDVCVLLCVSE